MKTSETLKQTIEFTIEKLETYTVCRNREIRCTECDSAEAMLRPEHAARHAGIRERDIYRVIESGNIHFAESREGTILVCINSLSKESKKMTKS